MFGTKLPKASNNVKFLLASTSLKTISLFNVKDGTGDSGAGLTNYHNKSHYLLGSRINCIDTRYNINDEYSL